MTDTGDPGSRQFGDVSFGNVSGGQFVMGNQNVASQQNITLSPEEMAELRQEFDGLRTEAASALPAAQSAEAIERADELEREITAGQPDTGRIRRVLRWFAENAPALAGTVAHVVGGPLVGKLVEGAGEAIRDEVKKAVEDEL